MDNEEQEIEFTGGCMGPSKDLAYQQGEEAFNEVVQMLEENYGLGKKPFSKFFAKKWYSKKKKLKRAIQEMLWEDACDSF